MRDENEPSINEQIRQHKLDTAVLGQGAVTATYGMGIVVQISRTFPDQFIRVRSFVDKVERNFSPDNVRLMAIQYADGQE